jgi:hypothetical protein
VRIWTSNIAPGLSKIEAAVVCADCDSGAVFFACNPGCFSSANLFSLHSIQIVSVLFQIGEIPSLHRAPAAARRDLSLCRGGFFISYGTLPMALNLGLAARLYHHFVHPWESHYD